MRNFLLCSILLLAFCKNHVQAKCNPLCGTGVYWQAGTCQPSGRCLCFWGWTGPNAQYTTNNRILADYCRIPCHYTHDYKNPACVNSNHTGGECKVPTSTTPSNPCDPKCGNPPYFGRGRCLSNGRCLCWWGWTGPNACYVEDGIYKNRIIADYCWKACHFTPYVRNPKCLNGSWDEEHVTDTTKKTQKVQTAVKAKCKCRNSGNEDQVAKTAIEITAIEVQTTVKAKCKCNPLCGTGVYWQAGTCQPSGRCLCFWGWTGPNAQYTTNNRILADYCRIPCHYTPDYKNPACVNSNHTGGECKVPTSTTPTKPCDPKCGNPPYFGRGRCLSDGRCLCWWGWTGPNACYVEDGEYKNRIIADYCWKACHFTPYVRNPKCLNGSWDGEHVTKTTVKTPTEIQTTVKAKYKCNPLCGTGVYWQAGTCQPSGRCLCFWGWTGPNAQYTTNNRILADYCRIPCHYTPDYKNPACVNSNHTGGECKVPTSATPTKPCDPKCGNPPYFGRGRCLSNGRCLCWWGWTGPNACYVEDGEYKNRIIADYCWKACHFTPYVRNPKCLNGSWDGEHVTKIITKKKPTEVQTTVKVQCNPLCGTGVYTHAGTCLADGRCLCAYGWTGPHAQYTASNRILADYCRIPCHYTHDYENPECVNSNHTADECKVPDSTTPTKPCDPRCGKPPYQGKGQCLSSGRCLCWWGWTGPNACYVEKGTFTNRIIADYCVNACHYTPFVRNGTCLNGTWPPVKAKATGRQSKVVPVKKVKCDPKCGTGVYTNAGTCQADGRCLCFWGWTGPNAKYTTNNKILADYCRIPCHYTHDYANPECVNSNHTKHECVLPTPTDPKVPCDQRCGNPPNHGKGWCLRNGRCLCWWGWTGPEACYIDGGLYNNRILADYCEKPCHYTHDVRNATCLNLNWNGNKKGEINIEV